MKFTRYFLPNGRKEDVEIPRPADVEALAAEFVGRGGYFELEALRTGEVSVTACLDGEDVEIEIVSDSEGLGPGLDIVVRRAAATRVGKDPF